MSTSFVNPVTITCQTPLYVGLPRQEYWSGLPFPSAGDLPDPGMEPTSLALIGGFFTTEPPGKAQLAIRPQHLLTQLSVLVTTSCIISYNPHNNLLRKVLQFTQLCLTLCHPMDCSTPFFILI